MDPSCICPVSSTWQGVLSIKLSRVGPSMLALARFHEAMGRCSMVPPWLFQSGLLGREETSQPNLMTEPFRSAKPMGFSKVRTGSACAVFRVAAHRRRLARRSDRDRGCSFFCGWSIAGCSSSQASFRNSSTISECSALASSRRRARETQSESMTLICAPPMTAAWRAKRLASSG